MSSSRRDALLWLSVALWLPALEAPTFGPYFAGAVTPPADFVGPYTSEAYAWWSLGSFFHPVEWIPNLWNGYPAAASLQNSAWYLPTGAAALLTPNDSRIAAILTALHVAFAAFGVFVLLRRLGLRYSPSLLGLTAYYFAPAFFAKPSTPTSSGRGPGYRGCCWSARRCGDGSNGGQ